MNLARTLRYVSAAAAALGFVFLAGVAADAQVQVSINGSIVNINPAPILQAGRVFVPLRGVFEQLGATVVYSNGEINATGNGSDISLHIGSSQATVNGQPQTLDVAPFIVGESTYVPLRFVSTALGAGVSWDEPNRTVVITMAGAQAQGPPPDDNGIPSYAQATDWVSDAPPPIPSYEPPPCPYPNYIWTPGYWAWGPGGYYWVPGTWVAAPSPGLLWTPGYWGWQQNYYGWHAGYWAPTVGFYGGISYGAGYYGHGFVGGLWAGSVFRYNRAVLPVGRTIVNVYINKTVIVNNPTRVSYSGGPSGVHAQPTAAELAAARGRHVPPTATQQQHVQIAAQDRSLLARVNGGKPPVTAAALPLSSTRKPAGFVPITAADKAAGQKEVAHPSFARPAAPPVRPAVTKTTRPAMKPEMVRPTARPEVVRPAGVPAPVRTAAPAMRPVRTAAPAMRPAGVPAPVRTAPPERPAAIPAAPVRTAPPERPAAIPAAPVHTAAPHPMTVRTAPPRPHPASPRPKPKPTEPPK
jgi:hypothetical protein